MTTATADLLSDLGPNSDVVWLVQRVSQERLKWVVVPRTGVAHYAAQDPKGWSKVVQWLHEQGVTLVEI